jgi:hypothetical protein
VFTEYLHKAMRKIILSIFIFLVVCLYGSCSEAQIVTQSHARLELLSDVSGIVPGEAFWIGVRVKMDENWHIYWRNPGDSGLATKIKWNLPEGFEASSIRWPYPQRFDYASGLTSYGYDGDIIFISEVNAPESLTQGDESHIQANVSWLACEKICVPGSAELKLTLPIINKAELVIKDDIHKLFNEEKKLWPLRKSPWLVTSSGTNKYFLFMISSRDTLPFQLIEADFFPYRNDIIDHAAEQVFEKNSDAYVLRVSKSDLVKKGVQKLEGVIVSKQGWQEKGASQGLYVEFNINNE